MAGLALADRTGVRIRERYQPIRDHPVAGKALVGLGQQPLGRRDRLLQLADQPAQPPITRPAGTCPAGVGRHRLHLPQGVPGDRRDLAGEPVHLAHRYPGAPPQGAGQLLHATPGRPAPVAEPGPAGRPTALDAADQPTELADRVLQQVGVGG
jgi:hypothetical protein